MKKITLFILFLTQTITAQTNKVNHWLHPDGKEGDDSKGISAGTYWFGYSKAENPKLWEAASPLSYVSAQTPPTLFINSAVPWMHAGREDYIKVLDNLLNLFGCWIL